MTVLNGQIVMRHHYGGTVTTERLHFVANDRSIVTSRKRESIGRARGELLILSEIPNIDGTILYRRRPLHCRFGLE